MHLIVLQATFRSLVEKEFHSNNINGAGLMVTVSHLTPSNVKIAG